MHRRMLIATVGSLAVFTTGLLVLAGCGGGGGPITPPETGPPPSSNARFVALLPAAQANATTVGSDRCQSCHTDYHAKWRDTVHATRNVGCESCHGPGSEHVTTPSKTNILTYPRVTDSVVCGQCHGPTFDQHEASGHGRVVEDVIHEGETVPNTYVRTCFRCHSGPFRAEYIDNPMSWGATREQVDAAIAALPVTKLAEYPHETHQSATCANCHDPHQQTQNLTSAGNQAHLRRKTKNLDPTDILPGSPVRNYTTYNHMCGSCHNARGANPSDAALGAASATRPPHASTEMNMLLGVSGAEGSGPVVRTGAHTDTPDQCIHCHMPTRRHTFTVSLDISCQPCHTPTDAAARHQGVRNEVLNGLLALRTRLERWSQQTFGNPELWNYPSTLSEEGLTAPPQNQVPIQVKRVRYNYFFILNDGSLGIHNTSYTRHLLAVSNNFLDEIGVSRAAPASRSVKEGMRILERDKAAAKKTTKSPHGPGDVL